MLSVADPPPPLWVPGRGLAEGVLESVAHVPGQRMPAAEEVFAARVGRDSFMRLLNSEI